MEITEQNLIDIEKSMNLLTEQKSKLVLDKREIEAKNTELKAQVRSGGFLPQDKYNKILQQQNLLRQDAIAVERAINEISIELMKKSTLKEQLRVELKTQKKTDTKEKLIELRDFYMAFASDKTRVASMRAMCSEFAEKLEVLIKSI